MELIPQQIGPYLVREEIPARKSGHGAAVMLFRAWDTLYDRPVALKVLSPYQVHDAEVARRFISDARAGMALRHPNIVEIYDAGQAEGYHYVAMELADKGTLADLFAQQQDALDKRDTQEAIKLVEQVAAALDYAHAIGFVHGALTPENLLLKSDRLILLTNFGQGNGGTADPTTADPTASASPSSALSYLSPEQARGNAQVARQSDLFSLGVIVYRLLTGVLPFEADNSLALLRAIIEDAPTPAEHFNTTLTTESGLVLARAMSKNADERQASAGEFVRELRAAQNPRVKPTPALQTPPAELVPAEPPAPSFLWTIYGKAKENVANGASPFMRLTDSGNQAGNEDGAPPRKRTANNRLMLAFVLCGLVLGTLAIAVLLRDRGNTLRQLAALFAPEPQETVFIPTPQDDAVIVASDDGAVERESGNSVQPVENGYVPVALSLFEDPRERYQLSVPADVQLVAHQNGIRFESSTLPMQLTVFHMPNLGQEAPLSAVVDKYVQEKLSPTTSEIGNLQLLAEGERVVGGRVGYERTFRATFIGNPILMRLIAFKEGGQGYLLSTSIDAGRAPALESVVQAIVESFQLRQPQNVAQVREVIQLPTVAPSPTPTVVPPTPIPPTAVPPTTVPPGPKLAVVGEFAIASESASDSEELTAVTNEVPVNFSRPMGKVAYAIWNPATDHMDTYFYNIATDVSWPRLANKRQPDFRFNGELVANSDGGGVENLVRTLMTGEQETIVSEHPEDSRPHWSPTGKMLVFDSTFMGDREHRLYIQDDFKIRRELGPLMYDAWELFGRYPIFLADSRIAYSGCNVWENAGSCGIYITDAGGALPSQATQQPNDLPTDNLGSRILFMSPRSQVDKVDNWDVYVVNADGSGLQRLTDHPGRDGLATASPDGDFIAFVTDREGPWAVYVMRPDGSEQRKLFDLGGEYGRGEQYWSQDWKQERISWGR